ncbi:succinate dehydrogenase [Candidatus Binatia bacterium]|nr:succinate dehydrogenase [Candidatus Binatia bacterium]
MASARFHLWSSIGKKLLTGLTGVALIAFVIAHVAGNLTLFVGGPAFNAYAKSLHDLGVLVILAELGLLALFGLHAVSAVAVWRDGRRARRQRNTMVVSKGPPSKQTLASRTMIVTGGVLLVFVVLHVLHFRFGPGVADGYVTTVDGEPARDLYRLVVETFKQPVPVVVYMLVMVLLGFHLRHGVWSAFQSLGALTPGMRGAAFSAALAVAAVVALGFFLLPPYIYLFAPAVAGSGVAMVP